ncbi:MAG: hypothetical protein ACKOFH_12970 [Chthoniobacterales bacterium]
MRRNFGESVSVEDLRHTDSDKDGRSNFQEYKAATDPRNGSSVFHAGSSRRTGSGFEIRWNGQRGVKYSVLYSTNMSGWLELPDSARTGLGVMESVTDTNISVPRKFYRVQIKD